MAGGCAARSAGFSVKDQTISKEWLSRRFGELLEVEEAEQELKRMRCGFPHLFQLRVGIGASVVAILRIVVWLVVGLISNKRMEARTKWRVGREGEIPADNEVDPNRQAGRCQLVLTSDPLSVAAKR